MGPSMTEIVDPEKDLALEWAWLELDTDQSIRYHRKRAIFHRTAKNINAFIIIFIGGAAFSGTLTSLFDMKSAAVSSMLGLGLALTGAIDYIVGFGEQAKYHAMKRAAYAEIFKKLTTSTFSEKLYHELKTQYMDVHAEEDGRLRVVDLQARNEVIVSRDLPRDEMVRISLVRRLAAPFARFEYYIPQKILHAEAAKPTV